MKLFSSFAMPENTYIPNSARVKKKQTEKLQQHRPTNSP